MEKWISVVGTSKKSAQHLQNIISESDVVINQVREDGSTFAVMVVKDATVGALLLVELEKPKGGEAFELVDVFHVFKGKEQKLEIPCDCDEPLSQNVIYSEWITDGDRGNNIPLNFYEPIPRTEKSVSYDEGVRLSALGLDIEVPENQSIEIPSTSPIYKILGKDKPMTIETDGMALIIETSGEGDKDAMCEFYGQIQALKFDYTKWGHIYHASVRVMRGDVSDSELNLDIHFSEHVLTGPPPKVGDDLSGVVWLCGIGKEMTDRLPAELKHLI